MTPKDLTKLDYEVELAIIIGTHARYLAKNQAMEAVAGYCIANDVSERAFQIERGGQFCRARAATFGPLGLGCYQGRDRGPPTPQHLAYGQW